MLKKEKSNETKNLNKKWFLVRGIAVFLVIAVILVVVWKNKDGNDLQDSEASENMEEQLEQYMTINLFPGFSGEEAAAVIEGRLSNSNVLLEYAGSYDGIFYEDGQDQERDNVFSLLLTNVDSETLEIMQLWIEDENGEVYQFQVSALPSGGTVLAQELDGKEFRSSGQYKLVRDNFGFLAKDAALSSLVIEEVEEKIYVTNNSNAAIEGVQLIYKNWLGGHAYPGGIAYRIVLEMIGPGETLEITADHYRAGESQVTGMKQSVMPEGGANEESDGESTD